MTGAGPPVVLVHGLFGSRQIWNEVVPALEAELTVVRFDLRGHGDTGGPRDEARYRLSDFAGDLGRVCADLRLERPAIVGHSLGGAITLRHVLDNPRSADKLVLLDTWPFGLPPRRSAREIRKDLKRMRRRGLMSVYDESEAGRLADPTLGGRYRDPDFAAARRREYAAVMPEAIVGITTQLLGAPALTPELTVADLPPTLLACGAYDAGMAPGMQELSRALTSDVVELERSGHNPMLDAPADLSALLLEFLGAS